MKNREHKSLFVYLACITIAAAILLHPIILQALRNRPVEFLSVHPACTIPPIMGFAADSPFNVGGVEDLDSYPGIGPVLAQRIIENREIYGPYALPVDLLAVKGIGPKTVAALEAVLCEELVVLRGEN